MTKAIVETRLTNKRQESGRANECVGGVSGVKWVESIESSLLFCLPPSPTGDKCCKLLQIGAPSWSCHCVSGGVEREWADPTLQRGKQEAPAARGNRRMSCYLCMLLYGGCVHRWWSWRRQRERDE